MTSRRLEPHNIRHLVTTVIITLTDLTVGKGVSIIIDNLMF